MAALRTQRSISTTSRKNRDCEHSSIFLINISFENIFFQVKSISQARSQLSVRSANELFI